MKKKVVIAIIAAVVVIGGGIGGYAYHANQVKKENIALCKAKAKEIRMSSIRLIYGLKFITTDYIANWNSSIEKEVAINMSNKIVDCDDFDKAMSWRWSFYDKTGSFHRLDSCMTKMSDDLSLLASNEECDKQLVEKFKKEIDLIEKVKFLTKKPNGTLLGYSMNVSSLLGKLYELDEKISKSVFIDELTGDERTKLTLCEVWGEGLLDYPKVKSKVIKVTAKDLVFIDLKENLNILAN